MHGERERGREREREQREERKKVETWESNKKTATEIDEELTLLSLPFAETSKTTADPFLFSLSLVVVVRHKRHLGHRRVGQLPPDADLQLRPRFRVLLGHVTHRDVLAQAGAEGARAHLADPGGAVGEQDVGVLPWRSASGNEAHPANGHAVGELLLDHLPSQKVAGVSPPLANGPRQSCLDGGDVLVQVVAVEAQAGLQAQGVARAEAAQADGLRVLGAPPGEEGLGQSDGVGGRDGDLEAVLPRVA